ncbi:MAG: penicillin-binding protein 1C [Burkholderiaceae bacterium]
MLCLVFLSFSGARTAGAATPTFPEVRATYRTSETTFTDRHGEIVQVLRTDPSVRKLPWTTLADVSPALRVALVLSEDRRFYEHAGVDWTAVGSAAWGNLWNTRTRGASTITMQLAGLLDSDLRAASAGRSIGQKLSQAATALALERSWKKDQILEAYLNLVGYRGEIVGVAALSATLFEKYPSGLDAREAAITAALVRAPNAPAARVSERACAILEVEALADECRGLKDYTALVLARKAAPRLDSDPQLAPQFARAVLRTRTKPGSARPDATIATTLDARLQRFARSTLHDHLAELAQRNVEDGAVVVIDNRSGDVLAWVGSSGGLSGAAEVDHVLAPRQAGSTLKPFLYELAIEKRWLTAASILDDSPVDLATAGGLYIPQNYDHDFKGPVSVRTALASSLNVPAVRTLVMVTPERFHQRLRALGISTLRESGDYYGYSLALGSAEVTLADLSNAYRALANGGVAGPIAVTPRAIPVATASRPAMDAGASAIVADILSDGSARTTTFGMDSVLATRSWSAVKTGTSKDMRDNWCIGFTDRYTIGVWVGNSSGAAMWDVSGTTGAAPVWHALVHYLAQRDAGLVQVRYAKSSMAVDRAAVPGVLRRDIRFAGDLEAPRSELFLTGTDSARIVRSNALSLAPTGRRGNGAILHPTDGTIVAIDPDIPPQRQRLTFKAAARRARTAQWRLDGRIVGRGPVFEWALWPGRHRLELLDAERTAVDAVAFEVRGASVRSVTATK